MDVAPQTLDLSGPPRWTGFKKFYSALFCILVYTAFTGFTADGEAWLSKIDGKSRPGLFGNASGTPEYFFDLVLAIVLFTPAAFFILQGAAVVLSNRKVVEATLGETTLTLRTRFGPFTVATSQLQRYELQDCYVVGRRSGLLIDTIYGSSHRIYCRLDPELVEHHRNTILEWAQP